MQSAIYDASGQKLAGSEGLPGKLSKALLKKKFPLYFGGMLYLKTEEGQISVLALPEDNAQGLLGVVTETGALSREQLFLQLLLGQYSVEKAMEQCKKLQIPFEEERRVLSLYFAKETDVGPEELLKAVLDECALIAQTGEGLYAVAVSLPGEFADAAELAAALRASVLSELQTDVHIGIGEPCPSALTLARSYLQAQEALAAGKRITPAGGIWLYKRMLPELLLSGLPFHVMERFSAIIDVIDGAIDDDTESLVDELFARNLNISKTAQQLFMHRNTLIYKLEKLKKNTGLDITEFDDAVTLRLVLALSRLCKK